MIWVAVVITMLLFILVAKPTGIYLEKAFQGSKKLDKVFGPFEKLIFKITGVKEYNQVETVRIVISFIKWIYDCCRIFHF